MGTTRQFHRFPGIVSVLCCLTLAGGRASADDKPEAKDRIKELQKQRLKSLTTARDYLVRKWQADSLATEVCTSGYVNQMLAADRLVLEVRLELCDTAADRIKVIEAAIKEFEPIVAQFEKHFKAEIVDSTVAYHLAHAELLERKVALERARQ